MRIRNGKAAPWLLVLGVALAGSILVPIVPVTVTRSWSAICPAGTSGLCSIGDGSISTGSLGSLTYRVLGLGVVVWQGHLGFLQNGCHVVASAQQGTRELDCNG